MQIFLSCEDFELMPEKIDYIEKTINTVALLHDITASVSVSLTIVGEEEIQEINKDYRGIDAVTDVISFALDEGEEFTITGGSEEQLLGEIVICWQRVLQQAEEYGHSVERELCYLAAHGMLHLLGYDHILEQDKKNMRIEEEKVMTTMGLER